MNEQCLTLWMRARQLAEMERWREAFEYCRQSIVADVEAATPHGLMAEILLKNGYSEKAVIEAREACRLDPEESEYHRFLALAYAYCQQSALAHEELAIALELNPQETSNYGTQARVFALEESWKSCEESCRAGLSLDPDDEHLLVILAYALDHQGRTKESKEVVGRALRLDPESPAAQRLLGQALIREGSIEEAGQAFRESLRQDPDQGDWWHSQALKGARWWYRPFLRFTLFMAGLPRTVALGLVVGLWAGHLGMSRFSEDHPSFQPYGSVLSALYIGFVLYTWLADPIASYLLRRQGLRDE
jgi:tetratricopeptide (TPR) repeat protein